MNFCGIFSRRFLILFFVFLLPNGLIQARNKPGLAKTNADYMAALSVANRFLHAWASQDAESGLILISDAAKRRVSEDQLQSFFSPGGYAAYEISRGRKLNPSRYDFPVAFYQASGSGSRVHLRYSVIVVVRTNQREWAVDRLP